MAKEYERRYKEGVKKAIAESLNWLKFYIGPKGHYFMEEDIENFKKETEERC